MYVSCRYVYVYVVCLIYCMLLCMLQDESEWEPGHEPVKSVVPPPPHAANKKSPFNRSEFELFATHTTSAEHTGDEHGDRLLEWASHPKFRSDRRYVKMKTMGRKAVKFNIPAGVLQKDFSEPADGAQRMVFFYRSLYDAIKQLLRSARFKGRQYTEFERIYSVGHKRQYGAINRGEMYEICQGYVGRDVLPLPVFSCSDATVICKHMGAHPIICESMALSCPCIYTCIYMHIRICTCIYLHINTIYVHIHTYTYIYVCNQTYLTISSCI